MTVLGSDSVPATAYYVWVNGASDVPLLTIPWPNSSFAMKLSNDYVVSEQPGGLALIDGDPAMGTDELGTRIYEVAVKSAGRTVRRAGCVHSSMSEQPTQESPLRPVLHCMSYGCSASALRADRVCSSNA